MPTILHSTRFVLATTALFAVTAATTGAGAQRGVGRTAPALPTFGIQIGDVATYTFESPLENGLDVRSLEDLRGKPVLVEFWGVRCPGCINASVPAALRLQETYGEDLQVILVESQARTGDFGNSFALGQKWMGGRAMWTSERPFETGTGVLPTCVLLGADGRVLVKGNPTALHKELERQIAAQIEIAQSPPQGAAPAVRDAWAEFGKGRFARAYEAVLKAEVEHAQDPARLAAISSAREEFRARIDAELARVRWRIDHAWYDEAEAMLDGLSTGLKGSAEHADSLAGLRERLVDPQLAPLRQDARTLARLRARFFESGGDPAVTREIERFAQKRLDTPVGARAYELVRLALHGRSAR